MYSIILNNGKTIYIEADAVEYLDHARMIRLILRDKIIGRINMDNVIGYCKLESEEQRSSDD